VTDLDEPVVLGVVQDVDSAALSNMDGATDGSTPETPETSDEEDERVSRDLEARDDNCQSGTSSPADDVVVVIVGTVVRGNGPVRIPIPVIAVDCKTISSNSMGI
jgi:hypothetical protein